jgi:ABC-type proline/glycine betaine transport system permease subunit
MVSAGELMDKDHSRAVGTLVLIVLAIDAFIRFTRLEVRLYREEVAAIAGKGGHGYTP